ncbi:MAG: hypothetical protein JNK77_15405 [Saprospiraceae bacterium]|nr:hypothetical protein [Saprospiraceae bacterium]
MNYVDQLCRRGIFTLLLAGVWGVSWGQTVFSTQGGFETIGNTTWSYTVGEAFTAGMTANELLLTTGFQQPNILITGIKEAGDGFGLRVSPNPGSGLVALTYDAAAGRKLQFVLLNAMGQRLPWIPHDTDTGRASIDMSLLPSGPFLLQAVDTATGARAVIWVVKQ